MNLEQIDTSTTAGKAEVMRLAADGRQLLVRAAKTSDPWEPIHERAAEWGWRECEYAIQAEPVEDKPDPALLVSMAMRINHGFGLMDRMAQNALLNDMRKVWEKVVGSGYYSPDNAARHLRELDKGNATPHGADLAGEGK